MHFRRRADLTKSENMDKVPASPDSTPLDLSPNMEEAATNGTAVLLSAPKTDPDSDPERSADREAVALAMVMDLTKATSTLPVPQVRTVDTAEEQTPVRKKQRKRPREDEKICRVCGDKALAHNFDAITCESCKAFFRRNALRNERNTCLFKGECPISVQTRRFCPACRLQKCFTVGMKADLILDETERKARMEKVSENRAKRHAKDSDNLGDSQVGSSGQAYTTVGSVIEDPSRSIASPVTSTASHFTPKQQVMEEDTVHPQEQQQHHQPQQQPQQQQGGTPEPSKSGMTTLHYVLTSMPAVSPTPASQPVLNIPTTGNQQRIAPPLQFCNFRLPQKPPQPPSAPPLPLHQPHQNLASSNFNNSASNGQKEPDFQHVPRDVLPSDPHMYWRLSEEEKTLLTQLSSAYQDTIMTLPERVPCEDGWLRQGRPGEPASIRSLESIFETSEKNTRQLINFVQRLGDFHLLREDDKIAVLQASGMRSVILRWTALYVVERNAWLTRFGECTVNTASIIFGHEDVIQEMASFCHSAKKILKNDVTLFVLMHCLILFDPREQNLVDRQLINTFRDKYIILLKHYLESEYSFLYTERYMRAIQDKAVEIRAVAKKSIGILREFKEYVPPLMKQFLNLQEGN